MDNLKLQIKNFPNLPGVYRMINSKLEVIYIGKAKNLKKRVASYFVKNQSSPRTRLMISNINTIEFTITNTEADALILENNLIKKILPRYNVIFRDDKSYPYLMITGGNFPRLMFHRGFQKKENQYFGPFPNSNAVRQSIQLLQKVFMLRTCEDSVFNNRTRPCLQHQIKRCTAPCVGLISDFDYKNDTKQAALFLKGKDTEVIEDLTNQMNKSSDEFNFEKAAIFRDRIQSLRQVRLKQSVSDFSENDADIIAISENLGQVCVNLVMIRGGRHLGDKSFFPKNSVEQNIENIIEVFLTQYYDQKTPPPVLVIEQKFDIDLIKSFFALKKYPQIKIISRMLGDKKMWLMMANRNAKIALTQKYNEHASQIKRIRAFRNLLSLPEQVNRIECFDISHTMGERAVGSCVVFDKNMMQNKEYRRYNINNIEPGDDYAAMRQVLERRYKKIISEDLVRPDIILIDGGKGQLSVSKGIMEELGISDIMLVGVSKGRERKSGTETLFTSDGVILDDISQTDLGFHLIQQIRDEAHRFAITGHRARRDKARLTSSIEEIEGVGLKKRKSLLAYFGGLEGVKNATIEELILVQGISKKIAKEIFNFFH
ncbi:excinuclease ABC subunit UvrC [Methylophilaceae bacterium]|nr:excinuclease ABC subunit UvrC [Methylophilaceae bacterium]